MKVSTNSELIESRKKWAKRVAPVTMLLLVGGLITNFLSINDPAYFRPTLILLALGFVSAIFSSNLANNWVREPRADQTLSQVLKKFGNDYLLFNYIGPIPHTLIAPDAVYAFVVKNQKGEITVNGRKISRKFTPGRILRIFAEEGMGAPITEAQGRSSKLDKFFRKSLPDEDIPYIKSIVLFANPDAELVVNEPEVPVLKTNELKQFLRDEAKNRTISAEQRKKLANLLAGDGED
jgi:hypothetical protein